MAQQQGTGVASQAAPGGEKTELYRVVGPGSVMKNEEWKDDGKRRVTTKVYRAGELVELTAAEAKSFGRLVEPAENPQQQPPAKRKAGKYRLLGPETISRTESATVDGQKKLVQRTFKKGDVIELSAEDAQNPNLHIVAA